MRRRSETGKVFRNLDELVPPRHGHGHGQECLQYNHTETNMNVTSQLSKDEPHIEQII